MGPATLSREFAAGLLAWLDAPAEDRGIRFAHDDGAWDEWSYARLAELARRTAWGLVEHGVRRNDVVTLVERSGPRFVAGLFGAMLAGAVPSPLAPPLAFQDDETYSEHVAAVFAVARPSLVLVDPSLADRFAGLAADAGVPRTSTLDAVVAGVDDDERAPERGRADLALLQFTSGSSGHARGVRVPFAALAANVDAIRRWLRMTRDDPTASWLPVHHDMGLIGCLLTPVANGSDLWLLEREQFVRSPLRYLRCFGRDGARLTAMPTFGLAYAARRVHGSDLEGLDFSEWRAVIVGAERLDTEVLERFTTLLTPFGFQRRALLPAYGLAEATLAVTGLPLEDEWTAAPDEDGAEVVGCGCPLAGVSVEIVDDGGAPLPEGVCGEILVRGSSVAAGYAGVGGTASRARLAAGEVRTGDAGFVRDGQLFVVGRLGDALKLRGRFLFAEELEAALVGVGIPRNRVVALLGVRAGTPTVVALLERLDAGMLDVTERLLRSRIDGADVVVVGAPRGSIARTSSGKPKRRQLWQAFLDGRLPSPVPVGRQEVEHD